MMRTPPPQVAVIVSLAIKDQSGDLDNTVILDVLSTS